MTPIAAGLSALAASVSALSSTKLAMLPVAAGLAIGTAVGVTYVSSEAPAEPAKTVIASVDPAPAVAPQPVVTPEAKPIAPVGTARTETPCSAQTWPYIEAKCRVGQADTDRKVRFVMAPRPGDTPTEAQQSSDLARKDNPGLVSSSTVLHTPQPLVDQPKVTKRSAKRKTRRQRERRFAEQTYQVPSEYGRGNARIVVRPMPIQIDPYR